MVEERIGELTAEVVAQRSAARHHRRRRGDRRRPRSRWSASARRRRPTAASPPRTWSGWPSRSAQALADKPTLAHGRVPQHHAPRHLHRPADPDPGEVVRQDAPGSTSASRSTRSSCARARSVRDFFDPPKTVIGAADPASGDAVAALYEGLPGEVFRVPIPVAEMTKYADNSFHALKIGFANEIGAICRALGRGLAPGDGRLPGRPQAQHQPGLPAARFRLRRLVPAQGPARPGLRRPPGRRVGAAAVARAAVQRGRTCAGRSTWWPRPAGAGSACSACRSSPAPTTCGRARWSSWPSGWSARATTCASTTPT